MPISINDWTFLVYKNKYGLMDYVHVKICSELIDMLFDDFVPYMNKKVDSIKEIPYIDGEGEILEIENNFCLIMGKLDRSAS